MRFLWCAVLLAGCGPEGFQYGVGGQGPGHRNQQVALSAQQEVTLGDEAFQEVLSKEKQIPGEEGAHLKAHVQEVGDKIFRAALTNVPLQHEINLSETDPYGTPWNFNDRAYAVLDNPEVNAFCLPGGKVVVLKGLLDLTANNEDWLATVLGHEIAHAVAHHASERIAREQMYGPASSAATGSEATTGLDRAKSEKWKLLDLLGVGLHARRYADEPPQQSEQPGGIFGQLSELKFDRLQEEEADHIGVFLMAFADDRYDPKHAIDFWQAMEEQSNGKQPPEILSDHPSDQHRISMMRRWAVSATDARNAWRAGRIDPSAAH